MVKRQWEINCIWLGAIVGGEWLVGVSVKLSRPSEEMASDFPDMEGAGSLSIDSLDSLDSVE